MQEIAADMWLDRARAGTGTVAATVAGCFLVGGALFLYLRTGAPSILSGDAAEHQFTAAVVGVPHATGSLAAGLLAAVTLAVAPEFWSLATIAEVYTLQALFLLGMLLALLQW